MHTHAHKKAYLHTRKRMNTSICTWGNIHLHTHLLYTHMQINKTQAHTLTWIYIQYVNSQINMDAQVRYAEAVLVPVTAYMNT